MDAVHDILAAYDTTVADMDTGDRYEVELDTDTSEPLVIEKLDEERLSVAHYYTQRGDLMSDPEVVFRLDGDDLVPIRYTDHNVHHHEYDPNGILIDEFLNTWNGNLYADGYVEAASQGDTQ